MIFNPILIALLVLLVLVAASIKVLYEYERGVVFFLGRFQAVKGPGLIIVVPVIQQMRRVDLRTIVMDVPSQDVISRELDEMLAEREKLNRDIQNILDAETDIWGIKVSNVELKHVDIDESMIRAIARQAEAERERRAKIINAEGEFQAAERIRQAAAIIASQPQALQLRYLQTLNDIGIQNNTTVVFPVPMDLLRPLLDAERQSMGNADNR